MTTEKKYTRLAALLAALLVALTACGAQTDNTAVPASVSTGEPITTGLSTTILTTVAPTTQTTTTFTTTTTAPRQPQQRPRPPPPHMRAAFSRAGFTASTSCCIGWRTER